MPELPEIAQYKKYADATCLHQEISKVEFKDKKLLQSPAKDFEKELQNNEFTGTTRIGKYLFLETKKGKDLVLHFGMTGKLEYYKHEEHPKYSQMILTFKNSYHLAFDCRRKLGKIFLTESVDEFRKEHELGEDALDLDEKTFLEMMEKKKGSIKTALTDQHFISGIGNVYADEMLYQCKIHPKTKVEKLSEKEKKEVFKQMGKVLKEAIENEGGRKDFPSDYLTPHRKEGEDCPKCSGKIEMIKVSGRSTYFCPKCQKEK